MLNRDEKCQLHVFCSLHGALLFMAYEELKKDYSRYFSTPINKKIGKLINQS